MRRRRIATLAADGDLSGGGVGVVDSIAGSVVDSIAGSIVDSVCSGVGSVVDCVRTKSVYSKSSDSPCMRKTAS